MNMQHIIDIIFAKCKIYIDALFATFSGVPAGWTYCDGNNGTPDLRGLFIRSSGGGHPAHEVGGTIIHTHGGGTGIASGTNKDPSATHIPPYHTLIYMMKL